MEAHQTTQRLRITIGCEMMKKDKKDLAVPALSKNSSKKNWTLSRFLILGVGNTEPKPYQFLRRSQYGNKRTEDFLGRRTRKARHDGRK